MLDYENVPFKSLLLIFSKIHKSSETGYTSEDYRKWYSSFSSCPETTCSKPINLKGTLRDLDIALWHEMTARLGEIMNPLSFNSLDELLRCKAEGCTNSVCDTARLPYCEEHKEFGKCAICKKFLKVSRAKDGSYRCQEHFDVLKCFACGAITKPAGFVNENPFCANCLGSKKCNICGKWSKTTREVQIPDSDGFATICSKHESPVYCERGDHFVEDDDDFEEVDGEKMCINCFDEEYIHCDSCGEVESKDDCICTDDSCYCQDCAEEHTFYCEDCEETHDGDDYHMVGDRKVCDECFDDNYFTCALCDEPEHNDNMHKMIVENDDDGIELCKSCWEDKPSFTCTKKSDTYEVASELCPFEDGGDIYDRIEKLLTIARFQKETYKTMFKDLHTNGDTFTEKLDQILEFVEKLVRSHDARVLDFLKDKLGKTMEEYSGDNNGAV